MERSLLLNKEDKNMKKQYVKPVAEMIDVKLGGCLMITGSGVSETTATGDALSRRRDYDWEDD
ncbi:MAG: hypothetical protein IJV45_00150 [Prevotella sp.]|nr:hypothetical protein [Prevotella sp.]